MTQLIGCGLSVLEHTLLPSNSYSTVGLVLVGALIITAIWLLNDKTIAAFLWGSRNNVSLAKSEDVGEADSGLRSFDERARAVARKYDLTERETDVMLLFARGRSSSFIAETFCVSNNTVRSHIFHLYTKCDVHSRQELITLIDEWK